jgi:methionine-S-sulfoxide reductase/methionine-R-sulfoxide reductase
VIFDKLRDKLGASGEALPGRDAPSFEIPTTHEVLGTPIQPPFREGLETAVFGMGCFWGAERLFWQLDGVYTTAVGYAGGVTPYPTYREVCSGHTGHAEVVLVVYDPQRISYSALLRIFFEEHDPTQGMRQGNDIGTQYRSAIYWTTEEQRRLAEMTRDAYNAELRKARHGEITTEIAKAGPFYYAEDYHQQYLHKVPHGYCGLVGTGVSCPAPSLVVSGGSGVPSTLKPLPETEEEWKARLSREEYAVLRQAATERPFTGEYVDTDEDGTYHCRACGNPLFTSDTKYHSGCGWPSFWDTISDEAVEYIEDRSLGVVRTEVRCARCHSHLGHVFDDGPRQHGGQRYCMNSIAMELHER